MRRLTRLLLVGLSVVGRAVQRGFADLPGQVVRGSENVEPPVRVRRTRPCDSPRVLGWLGEQVRKFTAPPLNHSPVASLILNDFAARALTQGHSVLAEQQTNRRGCWHVRGLALASAVCPWDADQLRRWAAAVRCAEARRCIMLTAHCMQAPQLHEKYNLQKILQVFLMIAPQSPQSAEVLRSLAQNVIQRGRDTGFPLIRFDVANEQVAKVLEEIQLKKEWCVSFDRIRENDQDRAIKSDDGTLMNPQKHFIAVYTAFSNPDGPNRTIGCQTDPQATDDKTSR